MEGQYSWLFGNNFHIVFKVICGVHGDPQLELEIYLQFSGCPGSLLFLGSAIMAMQERLKRTKMFEDAEEVHCYDVVKGK